MSEPLARPPRLSLALARWTLAQALLMLAALAHALFTRSALPLCVLGAAGLGYFVWLNRSQLRAQHGFGWPNAITAFRGALCVALPCVPAHAASLLALTCFVLDGADGWLARHTGRNSELGARFDMETDAFFVASASVASYRLGHLGAQILLAGALRYLYVLTLALLHRSDADAPRTQLGRYVFAGVALSLVLSLWPLPRAHELLSDAALLALSWSFGRSFAWSLRAAR